MTYYTVDKDGNITSSSKTAKYLVNPLQTEEEIVYGHDGKLYLASQVPEPPPAQPLSPGPDYALINDEWRKVRYSKKAFMLWCGIDKMAAVNAVIAAGNPLVETVKDLLMAADYIDVTDTDTIQMINMLATPQGGGIMDADDVIRILTGEAWQQGENFA